MARTVRSPDGRTWTLERVKPESAIAAAKKEPVFWGSVVVTAILLGLIIWITIRFGVGIIFILTLVLILIWLIERVFSTTRPNLKAHTVGPPAQTFTWRTTHRYGLSRIEDRIATQIENGQLGDEPPGTVLIGV
jgi:type IV secretory pathway TrbD component